MPPRYVYWTIILEGKPTAFRSQTREELLPTLKQLQVRHPDAAMLWFARGRLWQSPEEERAAAQAGRHDRERRDKAWRPGGEHRDPRDRFKVPRDEKRRRFAANLRRDRDENKGGAPGDRPRSDRPPFRDRPGADRRGPGDRPWSGGTPRPGGDRARPRGDRPWPGKGSPPGGQRPAGGGGWRPRGPAGRGPEGSGAGKRGGPGTGRGPGAGGRGPGSGGRGGPGAGGGRGRPGGGGRGRGGNGGSRGGGGGR